MIQHLGNLSIYVLWNFLAISSAVPRVFNNVGLLWVQRTRPEGIGPARPSGNSTAAPSCCLGAGAPSPSTLRPNGPSTRSEGGGGEQKLPAPPPCRGLKRRRDGWYQRREDYRPTRSRRRNRPWTRYGLSPGGHGLPTWITVPDKYGDVNGNGRIDFNDVVGLFNNLERRRRSPPFFLPLSGQRARLGPARLPMEGDLTGPRVREWLNDDEWNGCVHHRLGTASEGRRIRTRMASAAPTLAPGASRPTCDPHRTMRQWPEHRESEHETAQREPDHRDNDGFRPRSSRRGWSSAISAQS